MLFEGVEGEGELIFTVQRVLPRGEEAVCIAGSVSEKYVETKYSGCEWRRKQRHRRRPECALRQGPG